MQALRHKLYSSRDEYTAVGDERTFIDDECIAIER